MKRATAFIDEHHAEVQEGETILHAATRMGIRIPTLCYAEGLPPEGGCRLCIVETGDPAGRFHAACHTLLEAGMEIRTSSERIESFRRDLLSLTLSNHPEATFHPNPQGVELEQWLARYGIETSLFGVRRNTALTRCDEIDTSHPYLRFDPKRCITCRRCLHACEEIQGQFVYGIGGRGSQTHLLFGPSERFVESSCTACGACVEFCPSGALFDVDRIERTPGASRVRSTCGYCGTGCAIEVEATFDRVLRIQGLRDAAVNRGHLCAKGRYAHAYLRSPDRLTQPLVREGESFRPVSWREALETVVGRLETIYARHGSQALGVLTSSRSTNEAAYLLQKLFRVRFDSNNVDCCARVCHSSSAAALRRMTGTGAASASYDDIERARCIVVAGANPTEAHPVVGARIKAAVLRGATLLVVDPRRIELSAYAKHHLRPHPGTNVPLFNAWAKLLTTQGWIDRSYLQERVEGMLELLDHLESISLEEVAQQTGLSEEEIRHSASTLGEAGGVLFIHGLGLSELFQGTDSVMALCNLGMLTGSIGRPGAGMLPLRGQNNVQGNADMGSMPDLVTGYQRLDDAEVRARLTRLWGKPPPREPGLTLPRMIDASVLGLLRGLWIQGEDIAQSDPQEIHVLQGLEKLDFLIVQEMFLTETARRAHVVLPAAGALEQEGTFTNAERRIQLVRRAVVPPGEARPDWEVIRDVAIALGEHWSYSSPAAVMEEIAEVAPTLFGGVRYERLAPEGLQWPCPDLEHPGTASVHQGGFLCGKGRLACVPFVPSPEQRVAGFPYSLITGRVLQQYNVGTMTRRTPNRALHAADWLEIHPNDAEREGIVDGALVEVESRWGSTYVPAKRSDRVSPGVLFLSFHYPETHANRLVGPQVDPVSHCPEYKLTAVRVRAQSTRNEPQA